MFIKKAGGVLLLLVILLSGCSKEQNEVKAVEDPNIATIQKYLGIEFNGPNEEYIQVNEELFKEISKSEPSEEKVKDAIDQYNQFMYDTFGPLIEEKEIEKSIMSNLLFHYHHQAEETGYTFKADQIQIKQQEAFERNYDYTVEVSYEKDGKENIATISGFVTMSENGKISGIRGFSDSGFYQEMIEVSNEGRDHGAIAWGILQEQFGRTDHKLNKLWASSENPLENQALVEYLNKKYSSYFSKEGFDAFITSFGFVYPAIAAENGYELSVGEIQVIQDENDPTLYSTTVVVHYKKEGGEEKTAIVTGVATIKDGPVEKLEVLDDGGLKDALQK